MSGLGQNAARVGAELTEGGAECGDVGADLTEGEGRMRPGWGAGCGCKQATEASH